MLLSSFPSFSIVLVSSRTIVFLFCPPPFTCIVQDKQTRHRSQCLREKKGAGWAGRGKLSLKNMTSDGEEEAPMYMYLLLLYICGPLSHGKFQVMITFSLLPSHFLLELPRNESPCISRTEDRGQAPTDPSYRYCTAAAYRTKLRLSGRSKGPTLPSITALLSWFQPGPGT